MQDNRGERMGFPRVLLADDTPEMLEEIVQLLRSEFNIVGLARDGREALDCAASADIDCFILDITMPHVDGIQVASRLRAEGHKAKIVFVTAHEDQDYLEAAWSVGAVGYVVKSRLASDLIPALKDALAGRVFNSLLEPGIRDAEIRL